MKLEKKCFYLRAADGFSGQLDLIDRHEDSELTSLHLDDGVNIPVIVFNGVLVNWDCHEPPESVSSIKMDSLYFATAYNVTRRHVGNDFGDNYYDIGEEIPHWQDKTQVILVYQIYATAVVIRDATESEVACIKLITED